MTTKITATLIKRIEADPHMQGLELPIKTLEIILEKAIDAYYNSDKQLITDATYDILWQCLEERDSGNEILKKVGAPVSKEEKVKLPYYLGSLDKVKPNEKSLTKWLEVHKRNILISDKIDGLSSLLVVSLPEGTSAGAGAAAAAASSSGITKDGFKMNLYKHGDGVEGQDISHLLEHINIGNLAKSAITSLIKNLDNKKKHIALRGEIIIRNDIYSQKYSRMYPKARSLIAGMVNSKTPHPEIIEDMEIVFYELIYPSGTTFKEQFDSISHMGFNIANYRMMAVLEESQLPELLMEFKRASPYEIDGIVLGDSSKAWARAIRGNPNYSVAFKMQLEEQIATTKVINVEYNISKHGTLAPRIEYEPVVIKGDTHKYTTGFNLKYIQDNKINKGTQIQIIKSGDVIPYIYKILTPSKEPQMPPSDIKWHWNDTQVDAVIDDPSGNADVRLAKLVAFFKTMQVDGVGEGVIAKLVAGGYEDLQAILNATPDRIAQVDGFQLRSATNIYNGIHKVLDKPQPLERILTASGVFQIGLGEKKFKMLLDAIPEFLAKYQSGKITQSTITSIKGFSTTTADIFLEGMPRFIQWLTLHPIVKIESADAKSKDIPSGTKFAGMIVVFTGIRNAEIEKEITTNGGIVGSTISGKTTLLVAKDPTENSSKISKARDLGIQIIGYSDFAEQHGFKI
jgi:NAD-dependent DNA ligase